MAAAKKSATTSVKKVAKPAAKSPSKSGVPAAAAQTRPAKRVTPEVARAAWDKLREQHPDAHCELTHANAFQLLCATVLSAQTTDVAVNKATPALFAKYPTAKVMAAAEPLDLEPLVSTLGFFRMKAKSLVGLARALMANQKGEVPQTLDELVKLPGVGRKTANVVLGVIWGKPEGVVVDTHVQRLSQRLGWSHETEPPKIEQDLSKLLPRDRWDMTSHVLIFHGRRVCFAKKPNCEGCLANALCPSAFKAELVGRKPARVRVPAVIAAPASKPAKKAAPKKATRTSNSRAS